MLERKCFLLVVLRYGSFSHFYKSDPHYLLIDLMLKNHYYYYYHQLQRSQTNSQYYPYN